MVRPWWHHRAAGIGERRVGMRLSCDRIGRNDTAVGAAVRVDLRDAGGALNAVWSSAIRGARHGRLWWHWRSAPRSRCSRGGLVAYGTVTRQQICVGRRRTATRTRGSARRRAVAVDCVRPGPAGILAHRSRTVTDVWSRVGRLRPVRGIRRCRRGGGIRRCRPVRGIGRRRHILVVGRWRRIRVVGRRGLDAVLRVR